MAKTLIEGNPVVLARKALNLNRSDMALRMGIGYSYLAAAELGHLRCLPRRWRDSFQDLGFQFDEVSQAYDTWRASQRVVRPSAATVSLAG